MDIGRALMITTTGKIQSNCSHGRGVEMRERRLRARMEESATCSNRLQLSPTISRFGLAKIMMEVCSRH